MAVYFGQEQGLGELLGAGFGTGIGQLLQKKMQQMQTSKGLEGLLGPEQAAQISQLPPEIAKQVIGQKLKAIQQQDRINLFQQQYGGFQPGVRPGLDTLLAGAKQDQQIDVPLEGAASLQGLQPAGQVDQGTQFEGLQQQQQTPLGGPNGYVPGRAASLALSLGIDPSKAIEIEERAKESSLKAEREKRRETFETRKERVAEQREIDKETLPYFKETLKSYKGAKETERRIGRMENLVREGKLDSPIFSSTMDTISKGIFGFGINLDALRSPDSQEFKKLSIEFLKNAKNLFGPRVTQSEISMFMQMVPTLQQSDKGKLRVINNMKAYNEAEKVKKLALDQIILENNGRRPRNLEMLVNDRTEKQLDELSQQFKRGYNIEAEPEREKSSITEKLRVKPLTAPTTGVFSKLSGIADWLGG